MLDTIQEKVTGNMKNYSTFFGHCWYVNQCLIFFKILSPGWGKDRPFLGRIGPW